MCASSQVSCHRAGASAWVSVLLALSLAWPQGSYAQPQAPAAPPPVRTTITLVSTPAQLKAALVNGLEHIEVVQHLDLTMLDPSVQSPDDDPDLFRPQTSTKSIVVRICCVAA